MSKRESIARYNLIIKKLRRCPSSFSEICDYLALESDLQDYDFNVSKRTFQRDIADIRAIYSIDIQFDFTHRVYFIDHDDEYEGTERILEAFDTFNALSITDRLSNHIHFEKRRPRGTENLYGLLHAIKSRVQISFWYHKFWDSEATERTAEPYALKESRNRWYVLAKDLKDGRVKSFALDRLAGLEIGKKKFQPPADFDVNRHFKHCFGIIGPNNDSPQEVVLSFDPLQGKYIKSLPLHESQVILRDSDDELLVQLTVFETHDLIMEILSYGDGVRVIQPSSLVAEIRNTLASALKQY